MSGRLRVNPIACEAHGLCAEVFPEWISLDEWGYPFVDSGEIPPHLLEHAKRAADACPTLALLLERDRVLGDRGAADTSSSAERRR